MRFISSWLIANIIQCVSFDQLFIYLLLFIFWIIRRTLLFFNKDQERWYSSLSCDREKIVSIADKFLYFVFNIEYVHPLHLYAPRLWAIFILFLVPRNNRFHTLNLFGFGGALRMNFVMKMSHTLLLYAKPDEKHKHFMIRMVMVILLVFFSTWNEQC